MARSHSRIHFDPSLRRILLAVAIIAALLLAIFGMQKQVASQGYASVPQVQMNTSE